MEVWGEDALVKAFGSLIYIGISLVRKENSSGDLLQTVVPSIVHTLHEEEHLLDVGVEMLPTAAGLLTAAYFGRMPYEWRIGLGPILPGESMMFCCTACLVMTYVDDALFGRPGRFAEVLTAGLAVDHP